MTCRWGAIRPSAGCCRSDSAGWSTPGASSTTSAPRTSADAPACRSRPHPHPGLQTVTWLVDGEIVHRDSLGSDQSIRPGQLNLMSAGSGISHSEMSPPDHPAGMHGLQLWVALPKQARDGEPRFKHHAQLPVVQDGDATVTVLVGRFS